MQVITKAQRKAIKRVYDRGPIYLDAACARDIHVRRSDYRMTYRGFRRCCFVGYDGIVFVRWCSMTLGIERDGYTHS